MRTRLIALVSSTLVLMLVLAAGAAATPAGQLYAWGRGDYGQRGDGTTTHESPPELISGLSTVTSLAGGYYQSFAVLSNGTVEGWGYNFYGELGDGTTEQHKSPEVIAGLQNVVAMSAGYEFSVALLANGTVETWGQNHYGELGDGSTEEHKTPHLVPGLQNVVAISAGENYVLALLSNGTVEGWGYNYYGELGLGNTEEQKSPVALPGLSGVTAISADGYTSLALLANSTIKAAGWNGEGETGDGNQEDQKSFATVPGLVGVSAISGGDYFSLALLANGTVDSWGENRYSELGNGTESATPQLTPGAVVGLSGIQAIYGNAFFTLAARADGTLAAWGYNGYGETGDGTSSERSTPQTVPGVSHVVTAGHGMYSYTALVAEGAVAALSSSSLSFPNESVGSASPAQTLTLTNAGPAPLVVAGDVLTGPGAGAFSEITDGCHGATLSVGGTCSISLVFTPGAAGAASASLAISSTSANALPVVALSGTGVAPPAPPAPAPPAPPVRLLAPVLSALSLSHHSFTAIGPVRSLPANVGTVISYTDSEVATTTFTVQQVLKGLKRSAKAKTCGRAPRHPAKGARPCTYYRTIGSFTRTDAPGANSVRFTGRVANHTLKPGSYRLLALASSAGGQSAQQSASFKIKR